MTTTNDLPDTGLPTSTIALIALTGLALLLVLYGLATTSPPPTPAKRYTPPTPTARHALPAPTTHNTTIYAPAMVYHHPPSHQPKHAQSTHELAHA